MKLQTHKGNAVGAALTPGEPLWQRAPTRDSDGRALTDFMMLIPRLGSQSSGEIERVSRLIRGVLGLFKEVVFADLNLKLNVLWVSLKPRHGAIAEIAAIIRTLVPGAVLVAHHVEPF